MLRPFRFGVPAVSVVAAAVAALTLPASPALASNSGHACETKASGANRNSFCLGASSLTSGTSILERTPGRTLSFVSNGGTFQGHQTGTLKFTGASNACAVDNPATDVTAVLVAGCSAAGSNWAQVSEGNGQFEYINVAVSNVAGFDEYLSGLGIEGHMFFDDHSNSGYKQIFTWS
jgi:hypothetical protein